MLVVDCHALMDHLCPEKTLASTITKGRWKKKYKEDCASCAQDVKTALTNVMRYLGSQDPPGREDVMEKMKELLE